MRELNQLLLNFGRRANFEKNDYFVSKSNFDAYSLIEKWPKWDKKILNIFGEKFSGKSHLANIFKSNTRALLISSESLSNEILDKFKLHEAIIVDNFNNNIDEKLLYTLFNFIDQDNKFLLLISEEPINRMTFKLPDMISRSKNCIFSEVFKPDDELIFALLLKNFSDRQIKVDKKVIDYIIKRIDRSYRKINDFIYKVDELSLKKKKPINLNTIREIL